MRQEAKISSSLYFLHPLLSHRGKTFNALAKISYHKKLWKKNPQQQQRKKYLCALPRHEHRYPRDVTCSCSGHPKIDAFLKGLGHFCPQIQAETHLAKGSSWIGARQGHSSWIGSVSPPPSIGTLPHPPCHPHWQSLNNPWRQEPGPEHVGH